MEEANNEDNDHDEQMLHLPIYVSLGSEVRVRRSHKLFQAFRTALQVISTPATDTHFDIRPLLPSPPPSYVCCRLCAQCHPPSPHRPPPRDLMRYAAHAAASRGLSPK